MAVSEIAIGKGKNNKKAGVSSVPKPNPEKNVSIEAPNATKMITKYSIKKSLLDLTY